MHEKTKPLALRFEGCLLMALLLVGCASPPGAERDAAPASTSPEPSALAEPLTSTMPAGWGSEEPFPRTPSLLAGPFHVEGETMKGECAQPTEYAFYGDPDTRILDGVWIATKADCSPATRTLVELLPTAARRVDAFPHDKGIYAVLESVATRGQPAGMRTVVDVTDPRPSGIVPPKAREALLAMLPPPHSFDAAVYDHDAYGRPLSAPARHARVLRVDTAKSSCAPIVGISRRGPPCSTRPIRFGRASCPSSATSAPRTIGTRFVFGA